MIGAITVRGVILHAHYPPPPSLFVLRLGVYPAGERMQVLGYQNKPSSAGCSVVAGGEGWSGS